MAELDLAGNLNWWDIEALQPFLEERPAIHSGIRSLHLCLDREERFFSDQFTSIFTYPSEVLLLEDFYLRLTIQEPEIQQLILGEGKFENVSASSKLKVTKKFDLRLSMILENIASRAPTFLKLFVP